VPVDGGRGNASVLIRACAFSCVWMFPPVRHRDKSIPCILLYVTMAMSSKRAK
jgi:hypothetical protein